MHIIDRLAKRSRRRDIGALVVGSIELTKGAISDDSSEILLEQQKCGTTPRKATFRHRLQSLLRSIKFALLSHLLLIRSDTEKPKVALYRGRGMVLLHCLLHIPPFLGALTLILLNMVGVFTSYTPYWTTGLQFVAKFHELFIQASLSAILLHFIQNQAFTEYLPFGFFVAPTQTSNISYLWSLEHWSALSASSQPWRPRILTGLLVLCTISLAALAGPSSAVAMIPRPVTNTKGLSKTDPHINPLGGPAYPHVYFPTVMQDTAMNFSLSPGFDNMLSMINPGARKSSSNNLTWDLVIQEESSPLWMSRSMNILVEGSTSQSPKATASLPTAGLSEAFAWSLLNDMTLEANLELLSHADAVTYSFQAFHASVLVRCDWQVWSDWSDTNQRVQLLTEDGTGVTDIGTLSDTLGPKEGGFGTKWRYAPEDPAYSATVIHWENGNATSINENGTGYWDTKVDVYTCGIRAVWEQATYKIRGNSVPQTVQSISNHPEKLELASLISIDPEWGQKLTDFLESTYDGLLYLEPSKQGVTDDYESVPLEGYIAGILAKIIATTNISYVPTDHLSENAPGYNISCPPDFPFNTSSCTNFEIQHVVSGYGYGMNDTSVTLSVLVMFIYCVFVLAYLVTVFIRGTTSTALDTTAELITLALQSQHPKYLGHTSVGLETMATLRAPVGIRANSEDSLEMIFKDDEGQKGRIMTEVEVNKAY